MLYYGFRTTDRSEAAGALLVYAVYRSREPGRLKITPDLWGRIERATKSAAKRADDLGDFIERLKPKLGCSTIRPQYARTVPEDVLTMVPDPVTGGFIEYADKGKTETRQFLTELLEDIDHASVLDMLYRKTALIILLVRDRLERERNIVETVKAEEKGDEIAYEIGDE